MSKFKKKGSGELPKISTASLPRKKRFIPKG